MAKSVKIVNDQKNQVIGPLTRIIGSLPDISIAWRKLSSSNGPRIKAIRKGAAGTCKRISRNPTQPITNITPTSNILLLTANTPKIHNTKTEGINILLGISATKRKPFIALLKKQPSYYLKHTSRNR